MKVAMLAPVAWRTPPKKYGPWEQVTSNITEGLVKLGIDVTLFATKDSITDARLDSICVEGYEENVAYDPKVMECMHISYLMERASEFDLIHNNFDFLPLTYSRLIKAPMITTIHGFSSPKIIPVYKRFNDINYYVSISDADRSSELDYVATVYNGLNEEDFAFRESQGDYLLYFGRIHYDKGTYEAIRIAQKAKVKLLICGLIQDQAYFKEKVEPFIDNELISYLGNAGPEERDKLLGGALALLHPINFEEPFGLSVAEAQICGTPVIAFNKGSMPELILDEKTGFLVEDINAAAEVVKNIPQIKRADCNNWALSKFTSRKMVEGYLEVYQKILQLK